MNFKKYLILSLVTLLSWASLCGQHKVLFIGNSFTYGSNPSVPEIFDALARAGGEKDPLTVMRAVGGKDFKFHSTNPESQAAILANQWDYVILQNFSTMPTHIGSVEEHLTYGTDLYQQVITNNPETKVILYETWSRSAVQKLITGVSTPESFASTTEMQEELRQNYKLLADTLNATYPHNPAVRVAPCGSAWQCAGALLAPTNPDFLNLYGEDEYHGNDNGYYLNALVFYSLIYGKSPLGLHAKKAITEMEELKLTVDPDRLEQVAWETCRTAAAAAKED